MSFPLPPRRRLYLAVAACVGTLTAIPVVAQQGSTSGSAFLEEIVVTSQRRAESIQDVPIAVSAFDESNLKARRIMDARDLQNVVPNLNYVGANVAAGAGFQIRGVGNSVGGSTGDVGVGVHRNNAPQVASRIATAEAFDMERIEVLRGPQGTLYGRNSTGGVINYITAKPVFEEYSGSVTAEIGNYNNRKVRGMVNVPIGDKYAVRFAANWLERDGYTKNIATGNDIDDRDLWSARLTLGFEPTDWLSGWVLYEKFEEDDSRRGGSRFMCIPDEGPSQIGSTPINNPTVQNYLSRGCLPGSIYQDAAYGLPNSVALFGGRMAQRAAPFMGGAVQSGNMFAGQYQPNDLRKVSEYFDPIYKVEHEIVEFELNFHLAEQLTLSLLGHKSEDKSYTSSGDQESAPAFFGDATDIFVGATTLIKDGYLMTDAQGGPARGIRTLSINDGETEQDSFEVRLQSDFDGPLNFNAGVLRMNVERDNHVWVSTNATTLFAASGLFCISRGLGMTGDCLYWDENPEPDYSGHQYFDTYTPYELKSQAFFGEIYYDISDELKLTAGLRYTKDKKERINLEPVLLHPYGEGPGQGTLGAPGYPDDFIRHDKVEFGEYTGRIVLDWMPEVSFTDSTLVYASYSRGYKSGGFNSPQAGVSTIDPYKPEFVNSLEIGTKNIFAGGLARLNATLFYYDYQDYQISKIEGLSVRNENIDTEVYGLEIESMFELAPNLQLVANVGWLETEVKNGSSIDPLDRTAGNSDFTVLRGFLDGCVARTSDVERLVQDIENGLDAAILFNACDRGNPANGVAPTGVILAGVETLPGVAYDLKGNELPNAPKLSALLGLRYGWQMGAWDSNFVLDYSWKDKSYASIFNGTNYELKSWDNVNLSFNFSNYDLGVDVQFYIQNVLNDDTIVSYTTGSEPTGLPRGISLLDPRLFGLSVSYNF